MQRNLKAEPLRAPPAGSAARGTLAPARQRIAQSHCPDAAPLLVGAIDRRDHGRGFGPQIVDQFVESALRLKCLVELDLEEDDRRGGAGQGAFEGVLGKTVDIILAIR